MSKRNNDSEREMWVRNDEGLYAMWRQSRQNMRQFLKDNREFLDEVIDIAVNAPPREKSWRDYA